MTTTTSRLRDGPALYVLGTTAWFLAVAVGTLLLLLVGNAAL